MCRIFGHLGASSISVNEVENASKSMFNGGPDHQDYILGQGWSLGVNRLAIQDPDKGNQPFKEDSIATVFNGEIYNFQELKKNYLYDERFDNNSDGSVIIPLYKKYGTDFVKLLDGMFCIAIIDNRHKKPQLYIFNDHAGMKSVYYYYNETYNTFFFSSEIVGLKKIANEHFDIRLNAVEEYFYTRAICSDHTIYNNIYCMNRNEIISFNPDEKVFKSRYEIHNENTLPHSSSSLIALLEKEVSAVNNSDVPSSIIASGGLDSSLISYIYGNLNRRNNIETFHVKYNCDWKNDESMYAKQVAEDINAKHHEIVLHNSEIAEIMDKAFLSIGQPNAAPHVLSTFKLFSYINQIGYKVVLTGEGADELFWGYDRFVEAHNADNLESSIINYLNGLSSSSIGTIANILSEDYVRSIDKESSSLYKNKEFLRQEISQKGLIRALLSFEQEKRFPYYILRRVDHLSMANSVETRMPICQKKVYTFSEHCPESLLYARHEPKSILKNAAKKYVSDNIIQRKKQPFTFPFVEMIKKHKDVKEIFFDTLLNHSLFDRILNPHWIEGQMNMFNDLPKDAQNGLWSIFALKKWYELNG